MKKFFYALVLSVAILGTAKANESDYLTYNREALDQEFAELTAIENQVQAASLGNLIIEEINFGNATCNWSPEDMDWGSFAWGFCCCPVGFFTVAINNDKDGNQKMSYWIGVVVSAVVSEISYVATPRSYYGY